MSKSEEDPRDQSHTTPAKPLHSWSHLQRKVINIIAKIITNSQCFTQVKTGVSVPIQLSVLREDTASLSFRLLLSDMK